jgi:hypothetical protein
VFGLETLEFWGKTAELDAFASAFECSFAINLLYSILLNFGSFSGRRIDGWAETERVRISAALAETPTFDTARFEIKVNFLKARWSWLIAYSNAAIIMWGVIASTMSVLLLIIGVAFYGKTPMTAPNAMLGAAALFGAIPIGLISCGFLHLCAKTNMWMISREWKKALKYIKKRPAETIAEARQALQQKPRGRPSPRRQ